jgi:hypothetical protein
MSDFEPSGCSTDDLSRLSALNRQLIKCRLDLLRRLGHARDIELLFISEDYRKPDWDLVECFGEEAQQLVREIFVSAHDLAHAEGELESRGRPI